jgi:hypothetical protein
MEATLDGGVQGCVEYLPVEQNVPIPPLQSPRVATVEGGHWSQNADSTGTAVRRRARTGVEEASDAFAEEEENGGDLKMEAPTNFHFDPAVQ